LIFIINKLRRIIDFKVVASPNNDYQGGGKKQQEVKGDEVIRI